MCFHWVSGSISAYNFVASPNTLLYFFIDSDAASILSRAPMKNDSPNMPSDLDNSSTDLTHASNLLSATASFNSPIFLKSPTSISAIVATALTIAPTHPPVFAPAAIDSMTSAREPRVDVSPAIRSSSIASAISVIEFVNFTTSFAELINISRCFFCFSSLVSFFCCATSFA